VLPQTLHAPILRKSATANALPDFAARERDRLGKIAEILASRSIRLGIELIGVPSFRDARGESPCFDHNPRTHRLLGLEELGGNVGWVFDSFHAYASGGRTPHDENTLVRDLICVHVSDTVAGHPQDPDQLDDQVRGLPVETGLTGVPQLLNRLARAGYVGPVTVEPWSSPAFIGKSPNEIAFLVAQSLRLTWPEGVPGAPISR
jgi:sugar phosphate isomerase/epimerase